ncbi:MAG TPA: hypothetical protein VGK30_15770 [Candidatus Binatia bacterium]|jgi:hypothetical protein
MQVRVPIRSVIALAGLALLVAVPSARATDSCRDESKQDFKDCKADAKETFQAAKDACLNRDHECVEVCRANRYDCRQATGFDANIKQCNDTLDAAKDTCRQNNPAGSPERDMCIDQAQVVGFQCRDSAREAAKAPLKQCRKDFQNCATACPPASPQAPADPKQCKADAKAQYKSDQADCVEAFQVDKDACRHRDHTCVEQCRADRQVCFHNPNPPPPGAEDQLNADIAACDATRDQAKANCHQLYDPPHQPASDLDTCIDNAQVAAFECRDQARENDHPGIKACRQTFQTCAQACPMT